MSVTIDELACSHAHRIHREQKYGEQPYTVHLSDVVNCLREFGFADDRELIAAAWLHDAMEDQETSQEWIDEHLGRTVGDLVWRVTNGPGRNRAERFENTWHKIACDQRALALKLADRIANVRACRESRPDLLKMYQKEYPRFREALHGHGRTKAMWSELDMLLREAPCESLR